MMIHCSVMTLRLLSSAWRACKCIACPRRETCTVVQSRVSRIRRMLRSNSGRPALFANVGKTSRSPTVRQHSVRPQPIPWSGSDQLRPSPFFEQRFRLCQSRVVFKLEIPSFVRSKPDRSVSSRPVRRRSDSSSERPIWASRMLFHLSLVLLGLPAGTGLPTPSCARVSRPRTTATVGLPALNPR